MIPEQFTTERLQLTLLREEDHDFVLALLNSEGWLKFIGDRNVHSAEDARDYIQKIKNTADLYYWTVRITVSGQAAGIISFLKRNYLDHFDIGFAFLPAFTGKGYAYEAAEKVLSAVRKDHSPVLATTLPGNQSSIQLLKRLGMHFKEEIRNKGISLLVYST